MENFTPIQSLLGGALIGLSAVMLLWLNGRIAGISGIFQGLFRFQKNDFMWRLFFLVGMILGSTVYYVVPALHFQPRTNYPISLLLLSGLLVGIGTGLSGGCTSGHGVCGIARLSPRSMTATATFFACGLLTVFIMRHIVKI